MALDDTGMPFHSQAIQSISNMITLTGHRYWLRNSFCILQCADKAITDLFDPRFVETIRLFTFAKNFPIQQDPSHPVWSHGFHSRDSPTFDPAGVVAVYPCAQILEQPSLRDLFL